MALSWAMAKAAEGGLESTTKRLLSIVGAQAKSLRQIHLQQQQRLVSLALLLDAEHHGPLDRCAWDFQCGIEACDNNHRPVLKLLRAHNYPWALECTRRAAGRGIIELLQWIENQSQPWPFYSSVCTSAQDQSAALRWLLDQDLPCPWTAADAARCPNALASLGDVGLMSHTHLYATLSNHISQRAADPHSLRLPAYCLRLLCSPAAIKGKMQLLKWLQRQQPTCRMAADICDQALAGDHSKIVHYLVAELQPPDFSSGYFPTLLSHDCVLLLAQAACLMGDHNVPQLKQLVASWYTFMGLQQWADNRMAGADLAPISRAAMTRQYHLLALAARIAAVKHSCTLKERQQLKVAGWGDQMACWPIWHSCLMN